MSDSGTPLIFTDAGPTLTEAALRACEARLGVALPSDYRAFLLRHNGGRVSPSDIELPEIEDGEVELRCLYGVGRPAAGDLEENQRGASARRIGRPGILIGDDSLGNEYLLSTTGDDRGTVHFVDLDAVWGDPDRPVPTYRLAASPPRSRSFWTSCKTSIDTHGAADLHLRGAASGKLRS